MHRFLALVAFVAPVLATACTESGSPSNPSPANVMLTGTVTETAPTDATRIAGATVTLISGSDAGRSATTDQNGVFSMAVAPGQPTLRIQAENYLERSLPVSVPQNQPLGIQLDPVFQIVTTTKRNERIVSSDCPDWWSSIFPPRGIEGNCMAGYVINVHHPGTFSVELTWRDRNRSPVIAFYRSSQGLPSGAPLLSEPPYDYFVDRKSAEVSARTQYVLIVSVYDPGGGPSPAGVTSFDLTLTHPK